MAIGSQPREKRVAKTKLESTAVVKKEKALVRKKQASASSASVKEKALATKSKSSVSSKVKLERKSNVAKKSTAGAKASKPAKGPPKKKHVVKKKTPPKRGGGDYQLANKSVCFISFSMGKLVIKRSVASAAAVVAGADVTKRICKKTNIIVHNTNMDDHFLRRYFCCGPDIVFWKEEQFRKAVEPFFPIPA